MGDMLSQAEIDALLSGASLTSTIDDDNNQAEGLTSQEIDALGEIGNISMGTSATTLFTLLGQKVLITTPKVTVTSWEELSKNYAMPYVAVKVEYTTGLVGSNLLVMKEDDVKIITDLMMGGEGRNTQDELNDLHLSAISEAMNQMVGPASTSMSSMFDKRIDISPPKAFIIHFDSPQPHVIDFDNSQKIVKIAFKMVIGDLIDSEIMQLLPFSFAKSLVDNLLKLDITNALQIDGLDVPPIEREVHEYIQPPQQVPYKEEPPQQVYQQNSNAGNQGYPAYMEMPREPQRLRENVSVQPAQFQSFGDDRVMVEKKSISIIMDVPLQVTVELGRTHKLIKDVLEFGPGSVIELDKLAGDPVDILVNEKVIAKGEVVVIDENFAVRVTDIVQPSKRL